MNAVPIVSDINLILEIASTQYSHLAVLNVEHLGNTEYKEQKPEE